MMNQIQKTALDFWLLGADFENEFRPHSDQKTSEYMKSIGHNISKSGIYKWRVRYNWEKELNLRIKQLTSENETLKNSLGELGKDEAVKKTISDLERNKVLLGKGYEILELKCKLIMEKYAQTKKLSNDDVKIAIQITQLVGNREDRLLDRKVVSDALGREEALKAIAAVAGEVEFEGAFDAEVIEAGEISYAKKKEEDEDEWE